MDVTINNRCSNIGLTSPVYFIKNIPHHIQFPQQVNSKSIMKANFTTGVGRDTFGGILLYRLQRKKDTSISTHLLVIWGYKSNEFYLNVLLIEYESTLIWNEKKLRGLYEVYNSQYDRDVITEEWLLDDNTELKTKYETSHGGLEVNIIISEEKDLPLPQKPLWVDPNR
jgi:hypothetical protein